MTGSRQDAPHGTRTRYKNGCHCAPCKAANAAYCKSWRRGEVADIFVSRITGNPDGLTPQQRRDLVVAAAGGATPELIEQLRSLLPEPVKRRAS